MLNIRHGWRDLLSQFIVSTNPEERNFEGNLSCPWVGVPRNALAWFFALHPPHELSSLFSGALWPFFRMPSRRPHHSSPFPFRVGGRRGLFAYSELSPCVSAKMGKLCVGLLSYVEFLNTRAVVLPFLGLIKRRTSCGPVLPLLSFCLCPSQCSEDLKAGHAALCGLMMSRDSPAPSSYHRNKNVVAPGRVMAWGGKNEVAHHSRRCRRCPIDPGAGFALEQPTSRSSVRVGLVACLLLGLRHWNISAA